MTSDLAEIAVRHARSRRKRCRSHPSGARRNVYGNRYLRRRGATLRAHPERLSELAGRGSGRPELMRVKAAARLAAFGERAAVRAFDLDAHDWLDDLPSRSVVRSPPWPSTTLKPSESAISSCALAEVRAGGRSSSRTSPRPRPEFVRRSFAEEWEGWRETNHRPRRARSTATNERSWRAGGRRGLLRRSL
jgi:hypothetical protein